MTKTRASPPRPNARAALTLVEMLAAIAVVAVLLAILSASMGRARGAASRASAASLLRSHAEVFALYTTDHRDALPCFLGVGNLSGSITAAGTTYTGFSYFDTHRAWHLGLLDDYYAGAMDPKVFSVGPREERAWPWYTDILYPCAFIADPAYWRDTTRAGPRQYRATYLHEIVSPSLKAFLVAPKVDQAPSTGAPALVALSDASVSTPKREKLENGYDLGDGYLFRPAGAVHFNDSPPLLHTIDGVRGRDFR
jgi:prepilin-type N-terminal cleavage/methylation domain-containing protein